MTKVTLRDTLKRVQEIFDLLAIQSYEAQDSGDVLDLLDLLITDIETDLHDYPDRDYANANAALLDQREAEQEQAEYEDRIDADSEALGRDLRRGL